MIPAELSVLTIIITAIAVLGLLATRLKQPTIVVYIIAGILIGPAVLGIVQPTELVDLIGDLGLALLLFMIGMEMNIREVRHMLGPITKIAGGMMVLLSTIGALIALGLGFNLVAAIIIGLAVMYGSTAVVVKMLTEKHENTTTSGKLDIGILLVEDIVVILLMALLTAQAATVSSFATDSILILGAVILIGVLAIGVSRSLLTPVFHRMATNPHYLFVAGLAWGFLFMYLAEYVQLSAEIGAFLAGLGLAHIPYTRELRERVRPLTALFMALFFVNLGLSLTLRDFMFYWQEAVITAGLLMVAKFTVIILLAHWQQYDIRTSFKTAINMTQTSEFSLIFASVAATVPLTAAYISKEVIGFLSIVALITMGLSSYLIMYSTPIFEATRPLLESLLGKQVKKDLEQRQFSNHAIVLGYTPVSKTILPLLAEYFNQIVVIDRDPDTAVVLDNSPYHHVFGDFHHRELREEAQIADAAFVISMAEAYDVNAEILEEVRQDTIRIVSASNIEDHDQLYEQGADHVLLEHKLAGDMLSTYVEQILAEEVTDDE